MKILPAATRYLLAAMLAWHPSAYAATISGIVSEQGTPVAEAQITLVNAENRAIIKSVYSATDGSFQFTVKPGNFSVGVFKSDYSTVWNRDIPVRDADVSLRIELINKAFSDNPTKVPAGDCD